MQRSRLYSWVLASALGFATICAERSGAEERVRFPVVEDGRAIARVLVDREDIHVTPVYDLRLDWRPLPGFIPAAERSLGATLLVSDHDGGTLRTAEYGGGVLPRRRPSEFAALRLVD